MKGDDNAKGSQLQKILAGCLNNFFWAKVCGYLTNYTYTCLLNILFKILNALAVLINSILLEKLSNRKLWNVAMGICPFTHKNINEVRY